MNRFSFLAVALLTFGGTMQAQKNQKLVEPEFNNTYCLLTSDTTYAILPKENGTIKEHQNKVSKWAKIVGGVSQAAGAAGALVGIHGGSVGAAVAGIKTMGTAASVGSMADAADILAGANGMDIVFAGGKSSYNAPSGKAIRIFVKVGDNEADPMEIYRIVRFNCTKKERRIQWLSFSSSLLGTQEVENGGYINFSGHKYGDDSYLLTIPEQEAKPGEYGVFYMSIITATQIPVGTFSIK